MKALVYDGVETLNFRDMPDPTPADNEHLVRISAVGICGSDMHAFLGHDERRPAPLILGHEAAGVIENGPQKGRRVTINPLVSCGHCDYCTSGRDNLCPSRQIISMQPRQGAFAQFVAMPENNLVTVPDHVSFEKAALAEPLAVSWHTARIAIEALHPAMDRTAIVIGGGAIGLAAALALAAMGLTNIKIIEPNDKRRKFLEHNCNQDVESKGIGTASIVIDAVGYATTRSVASELVMPGGVIAHVGLGENTGGLDVRRMTLQEITFVGTYTYTAQDFRDTCTALFDGHLGPLDWHDVRPLSEGATAFSDIRSGNSAVPKIILNPWA